MIAYLSDNNRPLAGVPSHLMERRLNELILSWYTTWKVRCLDVLETGVVYADISQASPQSVFSFLESVDAVAVGLEPQDIATFAGRSVASLAAADLLNVDAAVRQGCSRLIPEEVMDTIGELIRLALAVSEKTSTQREEQLASFGNEEGLRVSVRHLYDTEDQIALDRLRQAGIDVPNEISLEPPVAEEPEVHADYNADINRNLVADPFAFTNNE